MPGGAPSSAASTAPRTHEAAVEGHRGRDKRDLGEGRPKRTGGSEIGGPEMPRKVSRKSFEENGSTIDHMEHYKYVLSKLLGDQDDSFHKEVRKEVQGASTQNKGNKDFTCNRSFALFKEQISGLAKNDMEKVKLAIHEITTFLNNDVDEVDRDIQAMKESGETCQEAVKKLSTTLLGKLRKMAQGVDNLLNTAASKCRPMSTEEKVELGKRIRKLPEEGLNRIVEIITRRKLASQSSDRITMKLGELDDATLWRLYYHVEYVLKENKM